MKNRVSLAILAAGTITAASTSVTTQTPPAPDQIVAALKQNLAEGKTRLRQYEWIETTAISLKGEEKSRKQQRVYYGADGTLTKMSIGTAPSPRRRSAPAAAAAGSRSASSSTRRRRCRTTWTGRSP